MAKAGTRETKGVLVACARCTRVLNPKQDEAWWVEINGKEFVVCTACRNQLAGVKERKEVVEKEKQACLD